jgi:hypothetical protein
MRCYYLTGEKKGNKWIEIAGLNDNKLVFLPSPEWVSLMWTCLPDEEELSKCTYSESNPMSYKF